MAGKPRPMSQIKQLLLLHQQQNGVKTIARQLGISKNTVKSYLAKLAQSKYSIAELLLLDDPLLEVRFHAGNPAYKDPRYEYMATQMDYYTAELKKVGVTKMLLWEEYISAYPQGYVYSQFCFHLRQQLVARRPTMVLSHEPADKLYIDFAGKQLSYADRLSGELVSCQVFVACLPFSDYTFAMAVPSQRLEDFLYALGCCLNHLGGVPRAIVPDNLKSAIVKASKYEPEINRAMEDFANHYGTVVVPARPRKPRDKASVENQVKNVYTRVFARLRNQQFFDIDSLNQAIQELMRIHNQTRMQQKQYCRQERFIAAEKALLGELPALSFEIKYYREHKVAHNGHIYLGEDKHHYSVPFAYTGQQVKVIYTRSMVRIYARGQQIATHIRTTRTGGYTTQKDHLSSQHQHWQQRSPEYYISRARNMMPELHLLVESMFGQGKYPETQYRTCDGLFRLYRQADRAAFAQACELALEHKVYSYRFIQNILQNGTTDSQAPPHTPNLPDHHNIRGRDYYTQNPFNQ